MENCIFCQIANKDIQKEFTYEDEHVMVFPDIHPQKPIHLLIIPKKHVEEFTNIDDMLLHGKIGSVITKMIGKFELTNKGYKIVINGGGSQEVNHLHYHLLGPMGKLQA